MAKKIARMTKMKKNNITKDFRSFHRSKFGYGKMSALDKMLAGQGGFKSLLSPYILEERQLNVTQLDVFSRLMMDRIIFFGTEVNSDSANIAVSQLLYLENAEPGAPITIYLNTPGGECYSGLGIIDCMNYITSPVGTTCTGLAASMGAMLLMSGEKGMRNSLPHARVMIHQPLGGAEGQATDIEIRAKEILKLKDELYQIICETTGQKMEKVKVDAERDFWMTAEESKNYGIIDEVIAKKTK